MTYIKIENVRKSFDGKVDVLKDINLDVDKGELLTLLGPSGCGKSTLLRSIAGFNDIDSGAILIDGKDVTGIAPGKRDLGMVFQAYSLFPNMTVFDNIAYGLKIKGVDKASINKGVSEIISQVGLAGREKAYPNELSGGQQQRVALARALVTRPKVLLLDEPLSAIDPKLRKSLQEQIRDIQKSFNITTIFVTHDQEEAFVVSDRVAVMHDGKIVQIDEPIKIYTNPVDEFVAGFIGNYNLIEAESLEKLTGLDYSVAIRPEVIKLSHTGFNDHINMKGEIIDVIPKGNIIGYNVLIDGEILKVDQILDGENIYKVGEEVVVSVKEADMIKF